jgi:hypothetical protein
MRRAAGVGGIWTIALAIWAALPAPAAAQDFPAPPREEGDEPSVWFGKPNVGYGPFHTVSLSPFTSLRSGFGPRLPSALPPGDFELRLGQSWVSNASADPRWLIDFDVLRSNIAFSWGVSDRVRVDLEIESGQRASSTLETFVIAFHRAFGLNLGGRNQFAENDNRFEVQPPDGSPRIVVTKDDPQPYEQAALLTLQHTLTYGDAEVPAISWALSIRRDVEPGDLQGGSPIQVSGSLALAKDFEDFHFYFGANVAWFGRQNFFGLPLRSVQWGALVAVEWNFLSRWSVIGQYLMTSGAVDQLGAFSDPSHEVTAGFKWQAGAHVLLELAIIENIINFENSPDFGVHVALAVRW